MSADMSSRRNASVATLSHRHNDLTRQLILNAALQALRRATVTELTVRAVAKEANISERTVFRYFPSRDDFLDAVAERVRSELALPAPPACLDDLLGAPRALYGCFEANTSLTKAALHSELFPRLRDTQARLRWTAVRKVIDALAPRRPERERKLAAANIRYYLAATSWHYYRFYFGFSLEDTIACAEIAIRQAIEGLTRRA
jgi:AcrR family transcriptional regulator